MLLMQTWALLSCSQGQGVEARGFSLLRYYTHGVFCRCVCFIPPPLKGDDAPQREESLGRRKMRSSAGGWSAFRSPSFCCLIPGTFFTAVPSAHLWSNYNSSQPQTEFRAYL